MSGIDAFSEETEVLSVGVQAIESYFRRALARIGLKGNVERTGTKAGLTLAGQLDALADAAVKALRADKPLAPLFRPDGR